MSLEVLTGIGCQLRRLNESECLKLTSGDLISQISWTARSVEMPRYGNRTSEIPFTFKDLRIVPRTSESHSKKEQTESFPSGLRCHFLRESGLKTKRLHKNCLLRLQK